MHDIINLPSDRGTLKDTLLRWFDKEKRDLPWRNSANSRTSPYRVLVSELMLQQTTVETVKPRFQAFIDRFPDIEHLAGASVDEVLHAWQGLGYYRRARSLHAAAILVANEFGGKLPGDVKALERLPGIGAYTARAVAAIAFGQPCVPVDGNVRRVLSRLAAIDLPAKEGEKAVSGLADKLACSNRPGDMAEALMELGATCCKPRNPDCPLCPWASFCRARAQNLEQILPRPIVRPAKSRQFTQAFLIQRDDGCLLFRKRPEQGLLAGMIELPCTDWQTHETETLTKKLSACRPIAGEVEHIFTHIHLSVKLFRCRNAEAFTGFWHSSEKLDELALPTLTKKLLRHGGIDI